jgi:hypothetical protein
MKIAPVFLCLLASTAACSAVARQAASANTRILDVGDLRTEQIQPLDRQHTVVLLEGGILEEHGPYLPAGTVWQRWWTDTAGGNSLSQTAREALPYASLCVRIRSLTAPADCDRTVIRRAQNLETHRGLRTQTE